MSEEDPGAGALLERFDRTERLVHWTTALLLLVLIATGTILYIPSLMLEVGHRATIVNIHVIVGLALVAPLLAGLLGPWRRRLAEDLRRLDRWQRVDFAYFKRGGQRPGGKFNGGQKLASAFFGGGCVVMIVTGVVMRWSPPFPNGWASGATLVHDTFYLLLSALVVGHVFMALTRPPQLKAMFTGRISRSWAERFAPGWLDGSGLNPAGRPSDPPAPLPPRSSAAPGGVAAAGSSQASG